MKLLLDENIPRQLKRDLQNSHTVFTINEMGWNGKENGELLHLLLENGFEVLITGDKNLRFQQNFRTYPIPVLALRAYPKTILWPANGHLWNLTLSFFLIQEQGPVTPLLNEALLRS